MVNHHRPVLKPSLGRDEVLALDEVERYYVPNGVLRLFTTYFRAGPGADGHVGHGQYFDFDHVVSRVLDVPGLSTMFGAQVYGGGKGLDLFDMYVSSIGEGVERLLGSFATFEWHDRIRYGSYRAMESQGLRCLHPEECPIFSEAQFRDPHFQFDRWREDSLLGWIPGRHLISGDEVYVPAQLVLFVYTRLADEPRIGIASSGGLASHIGDYQARLHAVTELMEREAINIRWHARVPLDRIVLDVPIADRGLRRSLQRRARGVAPPSFYYQNLDLVEFPVVTAISFDPWLNRLSYNAGGGIGSGVEQAMRSALAEYVQSERSLRIAQLTRDWDFGDALKVLFDIGEDATPEKFLRFIQAIAFYGYAANADRAAWYFRGGGEVALSELVAKDKEFDHDPWARLCDALRLRRIDPILFDFTPRAFRHTKLWKAFIPQLTQAYPQSAPALGHPRFLSVPREAGRTDAVTTTEDLLAEPIPYP
jgi:ribosomal protein S12 methylthiotransferase accessory factor